MFTKISWEEYLLSTLIIIVFYYIVVLFLNFRMQIKGLVLKFFSGDNQTDATGHKEDLCHLDTLGNVQSTQDKAIINSPEHESIQVDQFIETLQGELSSQESLDRNSINKLLLELFKAHSNIRQSSYRSSINELIQSEGEKYGYVMPSEAEINVLWDEQA